MLRRIYSSTEIQTVVGLLLYTIGIVLVVTVVVHLLRLQVETMVKQGSEYLLVPEQLAFALPTAVPTNTPTLTPVPSATPLPTPTVTPTAPPLPPIRLEIPAIGVNSAVIDLKPVQVRTGNNEMIWQWEAAQYAVGHHLFSGKPGQGFNTVLSGHNNTQGQVFRYLPDLEPGDEVILYTADETFRYQVVETIYVPYRSDPAKGEALLQQYASVGDREKVTLISCWPYLTNADRIVVIAEPPTSATMPGDQTPAAKIKDER